uniref:Uncharacterized protein n=1 Tax=Hucho hucho TaxID=62062 RepID=A0A4W5LUM8_9TELE
MSSLLPQVFHCLNEILELCHNFCSLVSQNVAPLDERGTAQLDILVKYIICNFRASVVSPSCSSRSCQASGTTRSTLTWLSCCSGWTTTNTTPSQEAPWAGRDLTLHPGQVGT